MWQHLLRALYSMRLKGLMPRGHALLPGPKKDAEGQITEAGDMVVYVAGYPAIYGKQPLYFQDPIFIARAAVPEPKTSDTLRLVHEPTLLDEIKI
ncbi:hypothetical protein ADT29_00640 (plasmid) [Xylella fastidiosa]|uniref:type IV secretory system conjugative DNA transfer family protein n=3 Tax=Xylella fastidiosa TaxID=2371 RepID=UPI0007658F9E|nr:hypothetical protein ADT29_00640 [Xylella fastidiosa]NRP55968.1 hypothetical protein [Xylella fastidiosa]